MLLVYRGITRNQHLKGFLQVSYYCFGFKAFSASPMFKILNSYHDRSHPEFLQFVYSNLF